MDRYTGKNNEQNQHGTHGYFQISLTSLNKKPLLSTNNERAFIISQLQDLLSHRLLLDALPAHRQLASCIDLIAFSITRGSVSLIIFSIDTSIAVYFINCLSARLSQYKSDTSPSRPTPSIDHQSIHTSISRLRGPHHTLGQTIKIHLKHDDWEYDRYSSIGFYLHDRRGDWMRTWRIARLYNQDPKNCRRLIKDKQTLALPSV